VAAIAFAAALGGLVACGTGGVSGGAKSPEDAVRQAADGIVRQDVAKVLSVVNPNEVQTLGALVGAARSEVSKSGLVQASGVVEPWLSLSIDGLSLKVDKPRDDVALVTVVGGSASATVDESKMPTQIRPANPEQVHKHIDLAQALRRSGENGAPQQLVFVVLKRGDRWYISPTTSILEEVRRSLDLPAPSFANPIPLEGGSDSPDGVLNGVVQAVQSGDLRAAAGYVSTTEVPGLAAYYSSFAAELTSLLQRLDGQIGALDSGVESMSNGLKKVTVYGVSLGGTVPNGPSGAAQYRAGCVTTQQLSRPACVSSDFARLTGWKDPFVIVGKEGGKWQIKPIATALEYARSYLANGSINAAYAYFDIFQFAPTAATIHTGQTVEIDLNEAGFAHVVVVGKPGTCGYVEPTGGSNVQAWDTDGSDAPDCYSNEPTNSVESFGFPPSGKVDVVLRNPGAWQPGKITVTVGS